MKVDYIEHMGTDERVADAARVSFDKESHHYTEEQNDKLLGYLAKHGHWTPFSHPQITLRYTVPIFVARQEFKHIVGFTRNEVSRRYVDDTPEFYVPEVWRSRPEGSVKQGSGTGEILDYRVECGWNGDFIEPVKEGYEYYINASKKFYGELLMAGVAPEQARMVLPQSMYTSYYLTGSLAAFARMVKQRTDPHAQVEIQELAKMVDTLIKPLFPVSWGALVGTDE